MLKCKSCGGALDLTMSACPACGAELELGRLTGILGIVCRACDAYNEPGARTCVACGAGIGSAPSWPATPADEPAPGPAAPPPVALAAPSLPGGDLDLPLEDSGMDLGPGASGEATSAVASPTATAAAPPPVLAVAAGPAAAAPGPTRIPPPATRSSVTVGPPRPAAPQVAPPDPHDPSNAPTSPPGQPVVRAFQKGAPSATRFVPLVPSAVPPAPPVQPGAAPGVRCTRCGEPPGPGSFCQRCGQPLGAHGTAVLQAPPAARTATQVFGALTPGRAKLVLERGQGLDGATFRLNADSVAAGRTTGPVVFPDDPCLAPHHATFFYRDGALHVRDEGAPGGLYLRLRGPSVPLRPGDLFVVGDRLLRYAGPLPTPPPGPPDGTRRLGAPRPGSAAAVVEEWLEGGVGGRVFVRGGPSITIGRAGCAINLGDDPYLSQAHAELLLETGGPGAKLRDLGSANGTYVRVPPHAERELHDGDALRLGREVLRVAIA